MSVVPRQLDVITLFVRDLARAKEFYLRLFEVAVVHEDKNSVFFKLDNIGINLLVDEAAPDLISPALVAHAENGTRWQFTIGVEDLDATCRALHGLGVNLLNGPMNRPWGIRTASFADPDGNIWEIAQ